MSAYSEILKGYEAEGRLRALPGGTQAGCLDFSSNDYMGIAADPAITLRFMDSIRGGVTRFTSSASRLLCGGQDEYLALEEWLGREYGRDALLFNSGYHANVGCVSALSIPGTVIVADKLVHASIIDGIRLGGAPYRRFRHNDVPSLRRELAKVSHDAKRVLVIVESIYSMDGDEAPLGEIVALKGEFPKLMLYVDEAHALGVRGARGLGLCEETGVLAGVDVLVGTFGKAVASVGAFVAADSGLKSFLLNSARSFIFSTALPPVNVAYTRFVMQELTRMHAARGRLAALSLRFKQGLERLTGQSCVSCSQILPLMAGSNERAVSLSERLRSRGIIALPIRRPTVPPGTERLRFSLSAAMSEADIDITLNALREVL